MSDTMTADEFNAMQAARKPGKYRNVKTVVDGITFDSKAEAKRYGELRLRQAAGDIAGLTLQPRFELRVNGLKICTYVADFLYYEVSPSGKVIDPTIEDVKGMRTREYVIKRKLMKAVHGIDVVEVAG